MYGQHDPQDVAIFWDYENCHGPAATSGYEVVRRIRSVAHKYGSVIQFKAYLELSEQAINPRLLSLRSELQSSGVSLTDCPHNGRKNVADQMIIVDMLTFAIDRPAPATVILISGDRDFAYAASVLRLRLYDVVVISLSPPGAHPSLKAHATECLDWQSDILGKLEPRPLLSSRKHDPGPQERGAAASSGYPSAPKAMQSPIPQKVASALSIPESKDLPLDLKVSALMAPTQMDGHTSDMPSSLPSVRQVMSNKRFLPLPPCEGSGPPSTLLRTSAQAIPLKTSSYEYQPRIPSPVDRPAPRREGECDRSVPTPGMIHKGGHAEAPAAICETASESSEEPSSSSRSLSPSPSVHSVSTQSLPPPFETLVECLRFYSHVGDNSPLRSQVALDLISCNRRVYQEAGVSRFREYAALAVQEGIVRLGGSGGSAWIALAPQWA